MNDIHEFEKATYLDVDASPRYWEDATVNGVDDVDGTLIFGRDLSSKDNVWKVRINLVEGRIEGWPDDMTAKIHYKAPEGGFYWLTDADGVRIAKYKGDSVPPKFLCHGGQEGMGEYIIMTVTGGGGIQDYSRPRVDLERWIAASPSDKADIQPPLDPAQEC